MKKFLLIIGLTILVSPMVKAQTTAIKVNPLALGIGAFNFSFEKGFGENKSAQLGFYFFSYSNADGIIDTELSGIGITPEFRMYLGDNDGIDGWFVAPFLRYQKFTLSAFSSSDEASLNIMGAGVNLGRQWVIGDRVPLEMFLGPCYNGSSIDVTVGNESQFTSTSDYFGGFGLRVGVNVGFAF